jgi:NADH-quinone oxidoreductase subunit L
MNTDTAPTITDEHGHGEPHESPMVMLVPLMILALLSTVGGLVGIGNRFEHFLDPVFHGSNRRSGWRNGQQLHRIRAHGHLGAGRIRGRDPCVVPLHQQALSPAENRRRLNGFYTAVVNKYYVDEIYAKLFVKPLIEGSTSILWQGVDRKVIDDTVNNSGRRRTPHFRRSPPHAVRQPALLRRLDRRRLGSRDCLHDLDGSALSNE